MKYLKFKYVLVATLTVGVSVAMAGWLSQPSSEYLLKITYESFSKKLAEKGYNFDLVGDECKSVVPMREPEISHFLICSVVVPDGIFNYDVAFDWHGGIIYTHHEVNKND